MWPANASVTREQSDELREHHRRHRDLLQGLGQRAAHRLPPWLAPERGRLGLADVVLQNGPSRFDLGLGLNAGRFSVGPAEQVAVLEEALRPEGVDHVLGDDASLVVGPPNELLKSLPKLRARHMRKRAPGIAGDEEL